MRKAGPLTACMSIVVAAMVQTPAAAVERFKLPKGPGRELVYGHCQTCHDLQSVEDSAGIRRGAWDAVLDNMNGFGLRISDAQRGRILDYLGTYLGPHPPQDGKPETATPADTMKTDGLSVFNDTCIACHQADGTGKIDQFPPLAGNPDLFLSKEFPAYVVVNGIEGKIDVEGRHFDNVMPPFDFLDDGEIAAVIGYVRSQWGNDAKRPAGMDKLTADDVKAIRAKEMTSDDVYKLRQSLLK